MPNFLKILAVKPCLWAGVEARLISFLRFGLLPARRLPCSTRVILFFGKALMRFFLFKNVDK